MDANFNCWGVLMKTFAASEAVVSCQLLDSDVFSHCLCVAKFTHEPMKKDSSALGSFIFLWYHHFFLSSFGTEWSLHYHEPPLADTIVSLWSSQTMSRVPCHYIVIWFRFLTQWIDDHLCVYFISAEIECPSSLFPFPLSFLFFSPYVFTNSFSLLLHICLQLMHTLRFSSNWHLFYRV